MAQTKLLGRVQLDEKELAKDLDRLRDFALPAPYPEFSCGRPWRGCMLWSSGGEIGQGVITSYDTALVSRPTPYGAELNYIRSVMEEAFAVQHLLFARLAVMVDDVFVPHRDYVELAGKPSTERAGFRVHVPLVTHEDCLFIQNDTVFRMLPGEVWHLDVGCLHSAGVLSERERVHLILDFADDVNSVADLLRFAVDPAEGIPASHATDRAGLSPEERDGLLALASVIDVDNVYQVLGILTKKSYRRQCDLRSVWATLGEIARRSGDGDVEARVRELYDYCVLARDK